MSIGFLGLGLIPALAIEVLWALQLVVKAWALVDATLRRADAYPAVDRLTKPAWLWILGISLLLAVIPFIGPLSIFSLAGDVAAGVYLLDVRPRLRAVTGR